MTNRLGDEEVEGMVHCAEFAGDASGVKHREETVWKCIRNCEFL